MLEEKINFLESKLGEEKGKKKSFKKYEIEDYEAVDDLFYCLLGNIYDGIP